MTEKAQQEEACINSVRAIREAIDDLAKTQDEALLATFGTSPDDNAISSDSESSLYSLSEIEEFDRPPEEGILELEEFKQIVSKCHFNWFNIVESCRNVNEEALAATLNKALHDNNLDLESSKITLLLQSRDAYHNAASDAYESERIARAVNGEIVTDSEADVSPEQLVGLNSITSEKGKLIVQKQRAAIKSRAQRLKVRMIAEEKFLTHKVSKRISKIQQEFPAIGKMIEDFVSAGSVGADQWRRTGVLTFDGNVKVGKKVTYQKIQQHLKKVYNTIAIFHMALLSSFAFHEIKGGNRHPDIRVWQ
ncbi:uncharacterized protein [Dysidea avara]|uniref:uncharacterized protein n=1 Tax=Dysidea avara TaxID=196820 RepID=UPI00332DAE11